MFNLETFESNVYRRNHEDAARDLLRLLGMLDRNYGSLGSEFSALGLPGFDDRQQLNHIVNRIVAAASTLISDPQFNVSDLGFSQLILFQRWISTLYGASAFRNADHIIRALNARGANAAEIELDHANLSKFCLIYSPESEVPVNLQALWDYDKRRAAALFVTLMTPRFLGTPAAHSKREILLGWLPTVLEQLGDFNDLPTPVMHDVYMHSSYADLADRHNIKKAINALIRRKITQFGLTDLDVATHPVEAGENKPLMLIVLEWFSGGHSIYRTHSETMRAARERFRTVAIGYPNTVDAFGREVFDEFIELGGTEDLGACLKQVYDYAVEHRPAVLYMPSVGMFPLTMFLANLRLAPLQVAALGHPATTHSDKIDYISVEDDYVGDPSCFSEKLLRLPSDGQPYVPSRNVPSAFAPRQPSVGEVKIAVAATAMKLNPTFFETLGTIQKTSRARVKFQFLTGLAQGIMLAQIRNYIQDILKLDAEVIGHQAYDQYMECLNQSDMFISPFPFGNTNGIVDALTVGLPGVCKSGQEVFENIDGALFRRVGMPEWVTAASVEDYVKAVVRMAENAEEREAIRRDLVERKAVNVLFEGHPASLGERLVELLAQQKAGDTH